MKLSILVPVYNEEVNITKLLTKVNEVNLEKEIIVVDDCSSDNTSTILQSLTFPDMRVISHAVNQGKGAAIRTALAAASGDAVIIQDADLEYDPQDYTALLAPLINGQAHVVYGVRNFTGQKALLRWGNKLLTTLTNVMYGVHLHDMETCYKLMTTDIARRLHLECNRFDMEPEITAKITRMGECIIEVPISYHPREAKKLSPWRDGLPALKALIKYRSWKG